MFDQRVEIVDTEIDHPLFQGIPEVRRVLGKRSVNGWARLLQPGRIVVVVRNRNDAKVNAIPLRERLWVLRPEEYAANSSDLSIFRRPTCATYQGFVFSASWRWRSSVHGGTMPAMRA